MPTWNGAGLATSEQSLTVDRVWANLRGSAKLAVGRQRATDYAGARGLSKLLQCLRSTPLGK